MKITNCAGSCTACPVGQTSKEGATAATDCCGAGVDGKQRQILPSHHALAPFVVLAVAVLQLISLAPLFLRVCMSFSDGHDLLALHCRRHAHERDGLVGSHVQQQGLRVNQPAIVTENAACVISPKELAAMSAIFLYNSYTYYVMCNCFTCICICMRKW